MALLVLSTLARRPMHGYEIKLELRYKHVGWWAKCEHGHLYATLGRLEKEGLIEEVATEGARGKRVFGLTHAGREQLRALLVSIGEQEDGTYFDVDLFLSGSYTLPREEVLAILARRGEALRAQLAEAKALKASMEGHVPAVARLIMEHRARHLELEVEFGEQAAAAIAAVPQWRAFLGDEAIGEFLRREGVAIEGAKG
jgi:DNA-binding PadR family transcriptional regulator